MDHQIGIGVRAALVFVGNLMRAEKRGNIAEAAIGSQLADDVEDFGFGFERKAVACSPRRRRSAS